MTWNFAVFVYTVLTSKFYHSFLLSSLTGICWKGDVASVGAYMFP